MERIKDTNRVVIVATYRNSFEASLAKGLLEENGIPSFLKDDTMSTLIPLFDSASPLYGVKLCVLESDEAEAKHILSESAQ